MGYDISKNLAQSTLASGYTAGDTTITVQTGEGARFPASGDFVLAIDDPPQFFLKCTARSGDTLTVAGTGFDGSTPANVASATKVTNVITSGVLLALLAAAGFATSQTDLSGSRLANTVYHNTAAFPKLVTIHLVCSSGGTAWLQYGATSSPTQKVQGITMASGSFSGSLAFIVMPGMYYELTGDGGSVTGTIVWYETN